MYIERRAKNGLKAFLDGKDVIGLASRTLGKSVVPLSGSAQSPGVLPSVCCPLPTQTKIALHVQKKQVIKGKSTQVC